MFINVKLPNLLSHIKKYRDGKIFKKFDTVYCMFAGIF